MAVAGAVQRPELLIVPAAADHVTAVLVVPVTVAVNCCVPPVASVTELGEILMPTTGLTVSVTVLLVTVAGLLALSATFT